MQSPLANISKRLSGEKVISLVLSRWSVEGLSPLRVENLSALRVDASKIWIWVPSKPKGERTARNLLHGDHTAWIIWDFMVAMAGSHDIGTPCTILARG